MLYRAGPEEEQSLEQGVIDRVVQPGNERHGPQQRVVGMLEHQRCAKAHQDDADVFDTVIGQQTFEIMVHQRVKHAQQRRDRADDQQRHAPPQGRGSKEIKVHPRQPVNA